MLTDQDVAELERIKQVVNTYSYAVDILDFDLLATVFTEDGVDETDFPGVYDIRLEGFEAIKKHVEALHDVFPTSRHIATNHLYTIDGDTASGQTAFIAYHWTDGKLTMVAGGIYQDTLVKVDGQWRISLRRARVDWTEGAGGQYDELTTHYHGPEGLS